MLDVLIIKKLWNLSLKQFTITSMQGKWVKHKFDQLPIVKQ